VNYSDNLIFTDKLTKTYKYFFCIYHALLFLGFNEMGPVNMIELLAAVLVLLFSSVLNAILFGEMALLISLIDKHTTAY